MSTEAVFVQQFTKLFLHYREALATRDDFSGSEHFRALDELPATEREDMVAAARLALIEIEGIQTQNESRRFYATPGEAEWGC